jgi:hypothetical protein
MRGSSDDRLRRLGCAVTPFGLKFPPNMPFKRWVEVGRELGNQQTTFQWQIGDWWVLGKHRYGERTALVDSNDWDGPAFSTCVHTGRAARAFPEESRRRRLLVRFSHYLEVADLPPKQADSLLDWCEETATGRAHSIPALREEKRRRLEQLLRSVPTVEPTRSVAANLHIEPALESESTTYALLRMPETPSLEPEVQQLLGPSQGDVQRQRLNLFKAGLHYAKRHLPSDFTPDELEEAIEETKQLLDRLMKLRDQSGSDEWG